MSDITRDFNIVWYVLCWNEMPILPFVIDYWKQIARKVIVYDNNSTDGTLEYLKAFDWIEVRPYPFDTQNKLNDEIHYKIKNECWKEQKGKGVDFCIVSDLDEIIWSKNLYVEFSHYKQNNICLVQPIAFEFVSKTFPIHTDVLLHDQIKNCCRLEFWDKCILLSPDRIEETNYGPGSHWCDPKYNKEKYTIWKSRSLYLFHFKYLSLEYLIMKRFASKDRVSETNKTNNWGFEYEYTKDQIIEQFYERWAYAKNFTIDQVLKG